MPRAEDVIADRILESVRADLKKEMENLATCNTAECKRVKEQYEAILEKYDTHALKKLDKLDEDIVKMIEAVEKQYNTPVEVPPCPHCGYDDDEKPKVVGRCPDGHCDFDEYDKKIGMKKCTICGEDIEWE
jgi:hypothetical protein